MVWHLSFVFITCSFAYADFNSKEEETSQPVHVINVDIQDNHEEATLGAFLICELCQCVSVMIVLNVFYFVIYSIHLALKCKHNIFECRKRVKGKDIN